MTVTNTDSKVFKSGNGVLTSFDFSFPILQISDLDVFVGGVESVEGVGHDTTINTVTEGGTVVFTTPPALGTDNILLKRSVPQTQPDDLPRENNMPESTIESMVDRAVMLIQQLQEQIDRSLVLSEISTASGLTLPDPSADKYLGWDSLGADLENKSAPTSTDYNGSILRGADASKPAAPSVGDLYFATDTDILYKCVSAGTWSYAQNSQDTDVTGDLTVTGNVAVTGTVTITGSLGLTSGAAVTNISTDGTLAGNSDTAVVTEKAIAAYVAAQIGAISSFGNVFVGSTTYDLSTATGDQAITGVGFQPSMIIAFAAVETSTQAFWGMSDGTTDKGVYSNKGGTADNFGSADGVAFFQVSSGNQNTATLKTFDTDGFTLTWTKLGTITGIATVNYIAIG